MSSMNSNQSGFVSGTLISLIVSVVFLLGAIGFGAWAFTSRQDYKNNSDQKAAKAADERQKATEAADAAKFAEEAKKPLKTYKAPDQFGAIAVAYPKTWSAYVVEGDSSQQPVDDYFHPEAVPDANNNDNTYALRVQVLDRAYDKVVESYASDVTAKRLAASPYTLPKVASVVGTRFDGEVERGKQGSLIVLPIRNMTLKIWTESPSYLADFNNNILPNLSFAP